MINIKFHAASAVTSLLLIQFCVEIQCKLNLLSGVGDILSGDGLGDVLSGVGDILGDILSLKRDNEIRALFNLKTVNSTQKIVFSFIFQIELFIFIFVFRMNGFYVMVTWPKNIM